jgi:hypothetical protein
MRKAVLDLNTPIPAFLAQAGCPVWVKLPDRTPWGTPWRALTVRQYAVELATRSGRGYDPRVTKAARAIAVGTITDLSAEDLMATFLKLGINNQNSSPEIRAKMLATMQWLQARTLAALQKKNAEETEAIAHAEEIAARMREIEIAIAALLVILAAILVVAALGPTAGLVVAIVALISALLAEQALLAAEQG